MHLQDNFIIHNTKFLKIQYNQLVNGLFHHNNFNIRNQIFFHKTCWIKQYLFSNHNLFIRFKFLKYPFNTVGILLKIFKINLILMEIKKFNNKHQLMSIMPVIKSKKHLKKINHDHHLKIICHLQKADLNWLKKKAVIKTN